MKAGQGIDATLEFWFGSGRDARSVNQEKHSLWWDKNTEVDRDIANRFGHLVAAARRNELTMWETTPRGMLALILLHDQFPRNIWRNSAGAFASDRLARVLAKSAVSRKMDLELRPIERVFLYLPFEHSESLADQECSLDLFRQLERDAPAEERQLFTDFLEFTTKHKEIIARFGRFPHRNAILGRNSTPAEVEFLKQPGSSF